MKRMNEFILIEYGERRKSSTKFKFNSIQFVYSHLFFLVAIEMSRRREKRLSPCTVHSVLCNTNNFHGNRQFVLSIRPHRISMPNKSLVRARLKHKFPSFFGDSDLAFAFPIFHYSTLVRRTNHIRCFFHIFSFRRSFLLVIFLLVFFSHCEALAAPEAAVAKQYSLCPTLFYCNRIEKLDKTLKISTLGC